MSDQIDYHNIIFGNLLDCDVRLERRDIPSHCLSSVCKYKIIKFKDTIFKFDCNYDLLVLEVQLKDSDFHTDHYITLYNYKVQYEWCSDLRVIIHRKFKSQIESILHSQLYKMINDV